MKQPVLVRFTNCHFEYDFPFREVRLLEKKNREEPFCQIGEKCEMCYINSMFSLQIVKTKTLKHVDIMISNCKIQKLYMEQ